MAEPFGIATGAVGIATAFTAVVDCFNRIQRARHIGRDAQTNFVALKLAGLRLTRWGLAINIHSDPKLGRPSVAPAELETVHDSLRQILTLFGNAEAILYKYSDHAETPKTLPSFSTAQLNTIAMPLDVDSGQAPGKRAKNRVFKSAGWALYHGSELKELISSINSLTDNIEKVFPPPPNFGPKRVGSFEPETEDPNDVLRSNIEFLSELAQQRVDEQKLAKVYDLLDTVDLDRRYNMQDYLDKQLSLRLEGTCEWIFDRVEFQSWISKGSDKDAARVLWIHGPAGFGKTLLCAQLIQHLLDNFPYPTAFFFSTTHAASGGDLSFIIRSWIAQMTQQDPEVGALILGHSNQGDARGRATNAAVWSMFKSLISRNQEFIFVLDGFDEYARNEEDRAEFLRELKSTVAGTPTRIMIVSRDEIDIKSELSSDVEVAKGQRLLECKVAVEDVATDVKLYSKSVVDKKLASKTEGTREKLASRLAEKCEGMFLWIKMQQEHLREGKNGKQLERIVENMPAGLRTTFEKSWDRIKRQAPEDQDRAFAILRWATLGLRPLTVEEIAEALVTEIEAGPGLRIDDVPDEINETFIDEEIIDISGSLIDVRSGTTEVPPAQRTIHPMHPSARVFLLSVLHEVSSTRAVSHPTNEESQHIYLLRVCLAYLNDEDVWKRHETGEGDEKRSLFVDYAAKFWFAHANKIQEEYASVSKALTEFLDSENQSFEQWAKYFEDDQGDDEKKSTVGSPAYYAALFELNSTLNLLCQGNKAQLDVPGGRYGTPLQAACAKGHRIAFEVLTKFGASPNVEAGDYNFPIVAAAAEGHCSMVMDLIDQGADMECSDPVGRTPLYSACMNGHTEVVRRLIDRGAKPEAQNKNGWTPINAAADGGYTDIVRLLLELDVNASVISESGWTALTAAADNAALEIVRMLLDRGVDPDITDNFGWTALNLAAYRGHHDVALLLLDRGANINHTSDSGWTPVKSAAGQGHVDVVRLLLDRGADIEVVGEKGWSPLNSAACNGHLEVVRLLLDHGSEIDKANENGYTPLLSTTQTGHVEVIRLLLDRGADIKLATHKDGWTAVNNAALEGQIEVVRLLIERGADYTTPTNMGWSPVNSAASNGHTEIVRLLLDRGVDIHFKNNNGWDPLGSAALSGHVDTVRLLLERGADINTLSVKDKWTPINAAASNGYTEVVRFLLEQGADIMIPNDQGNNVMDNARKFDKPDIVSLLENLKVEPAQDGKE